MAPGAAHAKSSSSILTNHLIIVSTVSVTFLLVSSDLLFNSEGGVVGTSSDGSLTVKIEGQEEVLSQSALKELSAKLLTFMRCITCATIAATQL